MLFLNVAKMHEKLLVRHLVPNFSTGRNHRRPSDQKYCCVQNATLHATEITQTNFVVEKNDITLVNAV